MMRARRSKVKRPRSSSQPLRGGLVDRASRSKIPRMAESGDEIESRLPASISRSGLNHPACGDIIKIAWRVCRWKSSKSQEVVFETRLHCCLHASGPCNPDITRKPQNAEEEVLDTVGVDIRRGLLKTAGW